MRRLSILSFLVILSGQAWCAEPEANCETPSTTYDFNICGDRESARAKQEMTRYLEASRHQLQQDTEALAALDQSQKAWEAYMGSQCDAIYTRWRDGTIRGPKSAACVVALTRMRTHELWAEWLTYVDSTPPVLPEPSTSCDSWSANSWTACSKWARKH